MAQENIKEEKQMSSLREEIIELLMKYEFFGGTQDTLTMEDYASRKADQILEKIKEHHHHYYDEWFNEPPA